MVCGRLWFLGIDRKFGAVVGTALLSFRPASDLTWTRVPCNLASRWCSGPGAVGFPASMLGRQAREPGTEAGLTAGLFDVATRAAIEAPAQGRLQPSFVFQLRAAGARPSLFPTHQPAQAPARTRSGSIARSNSANTPIIWNTALAPAIVVSMSCCVEKDRSAPVAARRASRRDPGASGRAEPRSS